MNNHIGEYVRDIRRSKRMSLKELSQDIVTESFLSKFERGQHQISAHHLFLMLERLNLTATEFYADIQKTHTNSQENFHKKLTKAQMNGNLRILNELFLKEKESYHQTKNYRHQHQMIILEQWINYYSGQKFSRRKIQKIVDYLWDVDEWKIYELRVFGQLIFCLSSEQLDMFSRVIMKRSRTYMRLGQYKGEVYELLIQLIRRLIKIEKSHRAESLVQELINLTEATDDYYIHNKTIYLRGLIKIQQGQVSEGKDLAEKAIHMMKYFKHDALVKKCQAELTECLVPNGK